MYTQRKTWVQLAIEEENRLGLTPLENQSYSYEEYAPEYEADLINYVDALERQIYDVIEDVDAQQRRSFLSAIFLDKS